MDPLKEGASCDVRLLRLNIKCYFSLYRRKIIALEYQVLLQSVQQRLLFVSHLHSVHSGLGYFILKSWVKATNVHLAITCAPDNSTLVYPPFR